MYNDICKQKRKILSSKAKSYCFKLNIANNIASVLKTIPAQNWVEAFHGRS